MPLTVDGIISEVSRLYETPIDKVPATSALAMARQIVGGDIPEAAYLFVYKLAVFYSYPEAWRDITALGSDTYGSRVKEPLTLGAGIPQSLSIALKTFSTNFLSTGQVQHPTIPTVDIEYTGYAFYSQSTGRADIPDNAQTFEIDTANNHRASLEASSINGYMNFAIPTELVGSGECAILYNNFTYNLTRVDDDVPVSQDDNSIILYSLLQYQQRLVSGVAREVILQC